MEEYLRQVNVSAPEKAGCKPAMIWYNASTMLHPIPIDISNIPELARLAEEVEATKTPRELKRENKTVAVIVLATKSTRKKKRGETKADYEAFFAAFGSWKDIDTDTLSKRSLSSANAITAHRLSQAYKDHAHFIVEALESIKGLYLGGEHRTTLTGTEAQISHQMEFDMELEA